MLDKTKYPSVILLTCLVVLFGFSIGFTSIEETSLHEEFSSLGIESNSWIGTSYSDFELEQGRKLVEEGSLGGLSKRISPFFVCTDCHNSTRDQASFSSNIAKNDLEYAKNNNLNYLPAASFYGMVNQAEYYSGDYIKKYGDLVLTARNSLDGAIQLCAQECSQGRELTEQEVTYIRAYLKNKELQLNDLFDSPQALEQYKNWTVDKKQEYMKQNFSPIRTNTFVSTNLNDVAKYTGQSKNGEYIFNNTCLSCHKDERVSFYEIANNDVSKKNLLKKLNNKENELLTILRYGTQPLPGQKAYMPQFTAERLNDQQIADLIAFLNEK